MSGTKHSGDATVLSRSPSDLQWKYQELVQLKQEIQKLDSSVSTTERLAKTQLLRNEAFTLRSTLPADSKNPSLQDVADLIAFGTSGIMALAKEGQISKLSSRVKQEPGLVENSRGLGAVSDTNPGSVFLRTGSGRVYQSSPFAMAIPTSHNGNEREQTQEILDFVKEATDRHAAALNSCFDRFQADMNSRLDRMEKTISSRFDRHDAHESSAKTSKARIDEDLQRHVVRCDEQFSTLSRKLDSFEDRQNRKLDELMPHRHPQPTSQPQMVYVNFPGQLPVLEGICTTMAPSISQSPQMSMHPPQPEPSTSPLTVNVPRVQKETPTLAQLVQKPVCSPSGVPHETSGVGTVSWGNKPSKPIEKPSPTQPVTFQPAQSPKTSGLFAPQNDQAVQSPKSSGFGGFGQKKDLPKPLSSSVVPASTANTSNEPKPALFGGFTGFGFQSASEATPKDQASLFGTLKSSPAPDITTTSMFAAKSQPLGTPSSFKELAESVQPGSFTKDPKGFPGSGSKLFGSVAQISEQALDDDADQSTEGLADESYEPNVNFKPLVSLAEVKVVTGEEDFEKVFSDRSKLFRFDKNTNEWKERGLGDICVLRKTDPGTGAISGRVLMRWEKTFKICANHNITPDMKMSPKSENEKNTMKWMANDFSDGEVVFECFIAKFKTPEQATRFRTVFESVQKDMGKSGATSQPVTVVENAKTTSVGDKAIPSLGDMFKPKSGEWNCDGCYVKNQPSSITCVACNTPKQGKTSSAPAAPAWATTFGKPASESTMPSSGGFSFSPASSESGFKPFSGLATGTSSTGPFGLGTTSTFPLLQSVSTPQKGGFSLGAPPFGGLPVSTTVPSINLFAGSKPSFSSGAPSLGGFSFDMKSSPSKKTNDDDDAEGDGEDVEAEKHDVYFEPIVKLPDLVDIKTGEENEVELYSQRTKLYRYADMEWKERGLGDLKLMKERNGTKIRMLMRREKILKVCCNQYIHKDLQLRPMPGAKSAWMWDGMDYSDDTPGKTIEELGKHETLAVRFKHEVHAEEFRELVERCKRIVGGDSSEPNVDKFERVAEPETLMAIAESGKKAVNMMDVNNPFGKPTEKADDVHNPPSSGEEELRLRQTICGDRIYRHFGVILNAKEVSAICVPSIGFLKLRSPGNLNLILAADLKSESEFLEQVNKLADRMDPLDVKAMPPAVRIYVNAMRVKETGEDEAWKMPIYERQLTLYKRTTEKNTWNSLNQGLLKVVRDGEADACYLVQFFDSSPTDPSAEENELAVHTITADAKIKAEHQNGQHSVEWSANDYVGTTAEKAFFKLSFRSSEDCDEFEKILLDGVRIAEEAGIYDSDKDES